jgi:hypothetical protein
MGGDQAANVLATVQRENFERQNKIWTLEEEELFKVPPSLPPPPRLSLTVALSLTLSLSLSLSSLSL